MKSSKKRQVTAAFFAAAALGGVAHAAPVLNMNDLVGSKTTSESTIETINNVATPVVRPMDTQPMVPRVRPVPVPDTAKALEEQYRAVSQPQYVVNKQTNTMMEPTLASAITSSWFVTLPAFLSIFEPYPVPSFHALALATVCALGVFDPSL